jgi:hypothetical protein
MFGQALGHSDCLQLMEDLAKVCMSPLEHNHASCINWILHPFEH